MTTLSKNLDILNDNINEKQLHEVKQLSSILNNIIHLERRSRLQVLLQNFKARFVDLIDDIATTRK